MIDRRVALSGSESIISLVFSVAIVYCAGARADRCSGDRVTGESAYRSSASRAYANAFSGLHVTLMFHLLRRCPGGGSNWRHRSEQQTRGNNSAQH